MTPNNVIPFHHPQQDSDEKLEQACNWLVRLETGASSDDMEALGVWLDADPAHIEILMEVAALWDQMSILEELSDIFPLNRHAQWSRNAHGKKILFATAASFLLGILVFGGAFMMFKNNLQISGNPASIESASHFETGIGEQRTVDLADGSRVIINTNTVMDISYSRQQRNIVLQNGEGYFVVAKDATRPFRVHAGNSVVEATGTEFSVQHLEQQSVAVTVEEGSVHIFSVNTPSGVSPTNARAPVPVVAASGAANVVTVAAGEQATMSSTEAGFSKSELKSEQLEGSLAWRHGMLLFKDETLGNVLQEFSRYTTVRIEADESVLGLQVGGYFKAGDIDGLMVSLQENFSLKTTRVSADHIVLSAR